MKERDDSRYCSARCKDAMMVRSVRPCTHCGSIWSGVAGGGHYCNGAWKLCVDCARIERRCVVCGDRVPDTDAA